MSDVGARLPDDAALAGIIPLPNVAAPATLTPLESGSADSITIFPSDESDELVIPWSARTHDGFREWAISDEFPERGKISFIDGELIVDMSPESVEEHSAIKSEIARVLLNRVHDHKSGHLHIDGVLISNKAARVSNEPDAVFLSRETLKSNRVVFTRAKGRPQSSKEIVGTVDWVLEIVSLGSRRKDKKVLRDKYFVAGIPEYWIVDALVDDDAEIDFQILVPGKDGYAATESKDGWLTSPTFGCSFRLKRERDEDGFWQYTLDVREGK
jgi:Uma2 family endonuclease